jgi:23S rRNA pseudouridine1911/1915/1917 synthase
MRKDAIEIIYEDNDILVVNKPSGVPVTKDRSGRPQLVDLLSGQLGDEAAAKLRLVHRLDKDTSGVMILARNRSAQRQFTDYFFERNVKKTYLALVKGYVTEAQGLIDSPIGHSRKNPGLMVVDRKRGKESLTEWRLMADFGLISLLAVNPLTGRTHQVRVHLPSVGLPLAVDPMYGSNAPILLSEFKKDYQLGKFQEEKPLIDRLTLHAYQLVIPAEPVPPAPAIRRPGSEPVVSVAEPVEGAGIQSHCFVARLDKKFTATIKMLAKHCKKGPDSFFDPDDFEKIIAGLPI